MNLSGMKDVDQALGPWLCGLVRAGYLLRPPRPRPSELRRILVIKFWGMGGLILTTPLFQALRASFPRAEIHLATLAQNRELAEWLGLSHCRHLLDLSPSPARTFSRIARFLAEIHALRADAALDLEYLTRFSALVTGFSRAPLRAGFQAPGVWRGGLHNLKFNFSPEKHVTENFLALAIGLGAEATPPPRFAPAPLEPRLGEELLAIHGIGPDERVIVVNPNAGALALERRWPVEHFTVLLERMAAAGSARLILIGAPEERRFVAELHDRLKKPNPVINLAGQLSFRQLAALLGRAKLLITNDSGPLHLAAILGTSTVSFYGPETPRLYAPRGPQHTALYSGLPCSPCIQVQNAKTVRCIYPRPECLHSITPDQAWAAVKNNLSSDSGPSSG